MKTSWQRSLMGFEPNGAHVMGSAFSTATTLTPPGDVSKILIQCTDADCRYTIDGSTPTATTGFQLKADDPPLVLSVHNVTLKMIEESATAVVQYQWGV
jgi:hypothetical protein